MDQKIHSSQVIVDAILLRIKRGPYNKSSKNERREKIRKLYFEKGYSVIDTAKTLGIHRNTVSSDVRFWRNEFGRLDGDNQITDYFYKQKSVFDSQKFRLIKKIGTTDNLDDKNKLEKLLFSLYDREMKFYLKFKPSIEPLKTNTKLVRWVIRELAFDDFRFLNKTELIQEIIFKTKCDVGDAHSLLSQMEVLGLDYTNSLGSDVIFMVDFAKLCGVLSSKEVSAIVQKKAQKEELSQLVFNKRLADYNDYYNKEYGAVKDWPDEVYKEYHRNIPQKL